MVLLVSGGSVGGSVVGSVDGSVVGCVGGSVDVPDVGEPRM